MRRQLVPALVSIVLFTALLGIVYPLVVTGVAQVAFKHKADGSLVTVDGKQVGSSLIGQAFVDSKGRPVRKYFQSRPSAALGAEGKTTAGYDPTLSSGSNLGPTNPTLIKEVAQRAKDYRKLNGLAPSIKVPVDAVTASGSGLDPDISVANARLQAARVARARGLDVKQVMDLVDAHTDGRPLGFIGEKTVNVLDLNLALDQLKSSS
jgi:potassium-transporting ATPase KdpC subunit